MFESNKRAKRCGAIATLVSCFIVFFSPAYAFGQECPAGDLNGDCRIDYKDLDMLTLQWLEVDPGLEENLDGIGAVDFIDYGILAESWGYVGDFAGLWQGNSEFVVDTENTSIGVAFGMHCLSTIWYDDTLYIYYIKNYFDEIWRSAVGLATSTDGLNFTDYGIVVDVGPDDTGGSPDWVYDAIGNLYHVVGRQDGDGWSASPAMDNAGFLCYGPYDSTIPAGSTSAAFTLMIDNNTGDNDVVVNIEVYDFTLDEILVSQSIRRQDFDGPLQYQDFTLNYENTADHTMEFRTYWHDQAYINEKCVIVTSSGSGGSTPAWDNRLASFPGVWKNGDNWYLVYEGASTSSGYPGDIGLATSSDGFNWLKDPCNPIMVHQSTGWECTNIGTPSLWKEDNTWYLFYHGYDGSDCQVGVATGTDLHNLTRHPANPIIPVSSAPNWDCGGIGKRSICKEADYYYMVFEGSTDPPYDQAQWSSGVARSTDLFNWTKFQDNPVLPQTDVCFGYDAPEWVRTPDGKLHIYYRGPNGPTDRATLTDK